MNQAGIGLGLTVSHMICSYMGGSLILVSSQEGVGSKFSIMIPILEKLEEVEEDEEADSWSSRTPSGS